MKTDPVWFARKVLSYIRVWEKPGSEHVLPAIRIIRVRDLESTPGQLYCLRCNPEISSTRKGRCEGGNFDFRRLASYYSKQQDCG
jgi:hypothetical protein